MEATKPDLIRYINRLADDRTPEICKIFREHGGIVERTPPYRPELHPMELIWSHLEGNYSRLYEGSNVAPFLESFFRDFLESELIATVDHSAR